MDGVQIVYFGEADHATKVRLYGGARALLYPVQAREPFGLVLAESMACGTPVAALDRGAVSEIVDQGVTGCVFESLETMIEGMPRVLALDRHVVRERAVSKFCVLRMVDGYVNAYRSVIGGYGAAGRRIASPVSPARPCWPSSRILTTSRWRAAGRWPGSPTSARG